MARVNQNFKKLPGGYLFPEIGRRVRAFSAQNPPMPLIRLGIGDVTQPLAPAVVEAMVKASREMGVKETFRGYCEETCCAYDFLRFAIRDDYKTRGVDIADDEIFVSDGAKSDCGSIGDIFSVDNVVAVCDPVYPVYVDTNAMAGRAGDFDGERWTELVYLPCTAENGFFPELPSGKAPDLIYICSPNNPTGVVYSAGTLARMADILRERQTQLGTDIVLISDEPYRELAYDGVEVPYVTGFYENTVICYSYSKSLSLPGERIGYLVIPDALKDSQEVFNAATIANRVMGAVNAPSLMQRVIKRCVDENVNLEAYDRNRNLLYNGLRDLGFECIKPEGAFYLFLKSPEADEKKFCASCKKYNILVVPGSSFACPGYVRISYCVSYGQIERSLPAFRKVAADYGLV